MGKVFKNGNSLAVTVPKTFAHQLSIRSGSSIEWKKTAQGLLLITEKKIKAKAHGVDAKFMKMVDEFVNKHADVLQELAKK